MSFLSEMIKLIESGEADIATCSRFVEKEESQSSQIRRIGIKFLSGLTKLLTGVRVKDITSGYRAANSMFINIFAEDFPSDYPKPGAMVIATVYGGKIREYPVLMTGISSTS